MAWDLTLDLHWTLRLTIIKLNTESTEDALVKIVKYIWYWSLLLCIKLKSSESFFKHFYKKRR